MKLARNILLALMLAAAATAQAAPKGGAEDRAPTDDEELAIAALEGLMAQDSNRSLPILKKVLAGNQTTLVKRRALFVLGQIETPEAQNILLETARSTNAELRGEAIRSIGIGGDTAALDKLKAIYKAGPPDVKKSVMEAWMISDYKSGLFEVASTAQSEEEVSEAIRLLGAMGASEELRKLNGNTKATRGLVQAYAISGDLESLRKIAEGTGDKALRVDAVQQIGIIDTDAAKLALREIYAKSADKEIKDAALHGMLIADDDKGLLELYRTAKNTEDKRAILRMITTMDGDAALQVIDQTLEKK